MPRFYHTDITNFLCQGENSDGKKENDKRFKYLKQRGRGCSVQLGTSKVGQASVWSTARVKFGPRKGKLALYSDLLISV